MTATTYHCKIKLLSPVHIGCDEDYEPTGFVLDDQNKCLIAFDPSSFLGMLEQQDLQRFSELCRRGTVASLLEIYRFMRKHRDLAKGNPISVSGDFLEHYRQTLDLRKHQVAKELNQFRIARTAYEKLTGTPYLPGTALKGAIRTAVLNRRNNGRSHQDISSRNLSNELLGGDFDKDPFRLVKVSDFHALQTVQRRIVYAVNKKKKPAEREAGGPYQILEVIETGTEFSGTITILKPAGQAAIDRPVTMKEICDALGFFRTEMQQEQRILDTLGSQTVSRPEPPALPVRIGRHSGAECVTIAGLRTIHVKVGRREWKDLPNSTTLWLAADARKPASNNGLRPFGWLAFSLLQQEESDRLQRERRESFTRWEQEGREQVAAHRRHQELVAREQEEQKRARQRAEEQQRQRAEEEKKYPWRKVLHPAESVDNWGDLRTRLIENEDLLPYQAEEEVGRAVLDIMQKIADNLTAKKRKRWPSERDEEIRKWLEPSGLDWQGVQSDRQTTRAAAQPANSELLDSINNLHDWKEWTALKTNVKKLGLEEARALKIKFQKWKLKKKGDKAQKKVLNDLAKYIRKLEAKQ